MAKKKQGRPRVRPKNGWYKTIRKDRKGNMRHCAILMKNQKEIKRRYLKENPDYYVKNIKKDQNFDNSVNIIAQIDEKEPKKISRAENERIIKDLENYRVKKENLQDFNKSHPNLNTYERSQNKLTIKKVDMRIKELEQSKLKYDKDFKRKVKHREILDIKPIH